MLIAISTYNERENLPRLVASIFEFHPTAHIVVVDDNSPDGTGAWCDEYAAHDERFRCIHREGKQGLGTATLTGLRYGLDRGYDLIATMDADFSHDPKYLAPMLDVISRSQPPLDVVIGSRYIEGGGVQGWPRRRRVMSRLINSFARWWLGLRVRDASGAFRIYRSDVLRRLDLNQLRSPGYSIFEEILYRLEHIGANISEHPIQFTDRDRGASKITALEALTSVWQLVKLRW